MSPDRSRSGRLGEATVFVGHFLSSIGFVGIDIGARGIKLLQVRDHAGELQVVGAGKVDVPPDGWLETDRGAMTDQLRAAFASGGFTGKRCVISLPRRDGRLHR